MPGDPLTDYSVERGDQLHFFGAEVQLHASFDVGNELILSAHLSFAGGLCLLGVYEVVTLLNGRPHRRKYGYQVLCGDLGFRYDRDPIHADMPEHKHLPDGRRVPWETVTLQEVVDEVVDLVAQLEGDLEREPNDAE